MYIWYMTGSWKNLYLKKLTNTISVFFHKIKEAKQNNDGIITSMTSFSPLIKTNNGFFILPLGKLSKL